MAKERAFKITDTNGETYGLYFIHTFDIGAHQMSSVLLKLYSNLPKGYTAGQKFWDDFAKTFVDFLKTNPEDVIYFCHRDSRSRNLARLRVYNYTFQQYARANNSPVDFFVCRGIDAEGNSRHIMVGMHKSNSDYEALKSTIERNADRIVREHVEMQDAEHSVLRI